jgi:hypothetical protein
MVLWGKRIPSYQLPKFLALRARVEGSCLDNIPRGLSQLSWARANDRDFSE